MTSTEINQETNSNNSHKNHIIASTPNLIQINLQNSKTATENVIGYSNKEKIDILLLQDFYHPKGTVHAIPNSS